MDRELIVLGTASQAPTRWRNHNGYLLRWDSEGILFDPGEGSQRQMLLAGASPGDINRICITHFHGDHCLGLPGMIQRLSLDRVDREVPVHFPASGAEYFARLRHASSFYDVAKISPQPIDTDGVIATGPFGTLTARRLKHSIDAYGYRLAEPDGRHMLPERLAALGIVGPAIGQLRRDGWYRLGERTVTLDEVSEPRRGQVLAFVMDTGWCDGAVELAEGADLLVCESTFLEAEARLAAQVGHLTAAQAGRLAAQAGVRRLVLTHFSQRYPAGAPFAQEAAAHFDGDIVVAADLDRIPVPPRHGHGD